MPNPLPEGWSPVWADQRKVLAYLRHEACRWSSAAPYWPGRDDTRIREVTGAHVCVESRLREVLDQPAVAYDTEDPHAPGGAR